MYFWCKEKIKEDTMKKVGILTIIDNNNYGNRLQNYAVQKILKNNHIIPITLRNLVGCNFQCKNMLLYFFKYCIKGEFR